MKERIAKFLARSGVCSRRAAEDLIRQGRISVNGEIIETPAFLVEGTENILFDGEKIEKKDKTRLWLYHKPSGLVTTHKDEKARDTVFANLPLGMPRVISVGRLDLKSEGLLLLTNDGALSRALELPSNSWSRRYKVKVHGFLDEKKLKSLEKGCVIDGVTYAPCKITIDSKQTSNTWLTISLTEGKNREIRKLMASINLTVVRLIRLSYGPFQLGTLKAGEVKEVPQKVLKEQLGKVYEICE
jgi:23S rRNA pseudouridine2605 synthase